MEEILVICLRCGKVVPQNVRCPNCGYCLTCENGFYNREE